MFDQNDQSQVTQDATVQVPAPDQSVITSAPAVDAPVGATDPVAAPSAPLTEPASDGGSFNTTSLSLDPPATPSPAPEPVAAPTLEPVESAPSLAVAEPVITSDAPGQEATSVVPTPVISGDLLSIKQNALQNLTPLLDHLEQTPEEKFRTTMMMIQASDDQSLIQQAYDAANSITDEKVKAQALLDVVNEINYFTQNKQATPPAA